MFENLRGRRTYILMILAIVTAWVSFAVGDITMGEAVTATIGALGGATIRSGISGEIKRIAPALFLVAFAILPGCAGLTPSGISPSTAGAPATASQGAQSVSGQQGQAPSTATGGTASIIWNFASQTTAAVQAELIAFAREAKASPEDLAKLLAATNGAPENVTITNGDVRSDGGSASSIPAGTGGGFGVGGDGNQGTQPPR